MATEKTNKDNKRQDSLSFADLIDINKWQKIQDNFSAVTGVNLRTIDPEGNPLTLPSSEPKLCSTVLNGSPQKDKVCGLCLPAFLGDAAILNKSLYCNCEAGLHNYIAPLRLENGGILAYIVIGPVVLIMRKNKAEYRGAAEKFNVNLEDFWNAFLEIKVLSCHGINSLAQLIKDVGEHTLNLAYKNIRHREELIGKLDLPQLNKVMGALLDVVFEVSQADIGSIMLLDKDKEELSIQVSKGIPDEIASNARVKLGEGVSGIAAEEGEAFLINENAIIDGAGVNRVRPYLKRPYITSSMVLPLKIENKIMGVMNIAVLQGSHVRFNRDDLKLVNNLINLAAIAVRP